MTPESVEKETCRQHEEQQIPVAVFAIQAEYGAKGFIACIWRIEGEKADEERDKEKQAAQDATVWHLTRGWYMDYATSSSSKASSTNQPRPKNKNELKELN